MLKHQATYEIMRPETVGASADAAGARQALGARRARGAPRASSAIALDEDGARPRVRALQGAGRPAEARHRRRPRGARARRLRHEPRDAFALEALHVGCGTLGMPTATVRLRRPRRRTCACRRRSAPGRSTRRTRRSTRSSTRAASLLEYSVHSVTEGIDALGEVTCACAMPTTDASTARVVSRRRRRHRHHRREREGVPRAHRTAMHARRRREHAAATPQRRHGGTMTSRARCSRRSGTRTSSPRSRRPAVLYIDLHLVHEVTSPQAFAGLRARGLQVRRPDRTVATMDHSIADAPNGAARSPTTRRASAARARSTTTATSTASRCTTLGHRRAGHRPRHRARARAHAARA